MTEDTGKRNKGVVRVAVMAAVAVVTVAVMCLFGLKRPEVFFPAMDKDKPQMLFLGDSNIDFAFEGTEIPVLITERSGIITYNGAVGGSTAAMLSPFIDEDNYYLMLSFFNMTRMMEAGDFSPMLRKQSFIDDSSSGISSKAMILSHLDYKAMDYVVIHYGLNDYYCGIPAKGENPADEGTYFGALCEGIKRVHKVCPNARIIVSSITYCLYEEDGMEPVSGLEYNPGGGTVTEYRDAAKEAAEQFDYAVFLDNLSGMDLENKPEDENGFMRDKMHFGQAGRQLYADNLLKLIKETDEK